MNMRSSIVTPGIIYMWLQERKRERQRLAAPRPAAAELPAAELPAQIKVEKRTRKVATRG